MVLVDRSYGQTDILHAVQVTYQKKQSRDTLKIRDSQTACEEALFPLYFMKHTSSCPKEETTVTVSLTKGSSRSDTSPHRT